MNGEGLAITLIAGCAIALTLRAIAAERAAPEPDVDESLLDMWRKQRNELSAFDRRRLTRFAKKRHNELEIRRAAMRVQEEEIC